LIEDFDPQVIVIQIVERRIRTCEGASADEDAGCDGSLVPRLPAYIATPRLAKLFADGAAGNVVAQLSSKGQALDIGLERSPKAGQLAIAKLSFTGSSPLTLKPAGKLAANVQYEQTEAELTLEQREAYVVLNADTSNTAIRMQASRPLDTGELTVEVRYVADDVDLEIPKPAPEKHSSAN
jgi:hypothetical protein